MSMTNKEVCHAFVHQDVSHGRISGKNGKGTIFYERGTIYSYGTHYVLGKLYMLPRPIGAYDRVIVRSQRQYSITTSGHQNDLWHAIDRKSMLEITVDDAATFSFDAAAPKEIINLIHTLALDEERDALSAVNHGNIYGPEQLNAVRGNVRLLTLAFNTYKRKITAEAQALIDRVMADDYVTNLLEASERAQDEREAVMREKRIKKYRKKMGDIIDMLQNTAQVGMEVSNAVSEAMGVLESRELPDDDRTTILGALTVCAKRITAKLPEMMQLLTVSKTEYLDANAPLNVLNIGHIYRAAVYLDVDTAPITAYYAALHEGAKAAYAELVENGRKGFDSRYSDLLEAHFDLHRFVILRCAFGGPVPKIGDTTYNSDARDLPNAVIWLIPETQRIRTSMESEITLKEFKRYCPIIAALNDGTMAVADIPEGLRKLMAGYRIHSYDRETGIIVVGCHRLLMRNITTLAARVCE